MSIDTRPSPEGAEWLARMRWGALAIVSIAILVATQALRVDLPQAPMWTLVAIGAVSNFWLMSRPAPLGRLGGFLILDVVLLTSLLYLSGGPTNPFSIIYVVYIAMSAVMLSPRWTWTIAALSVVSFGALFVVHVPGAHMDHGPHGEGFRAHLYGMLIALVLAGSLITYFVSQLSLELRRRERALAEAEERTHRWGKLASIAALAAGAAHELGTPLGTIAVAAKEMERGAGAVEGAESIREDAELIRAEVERCRLVLKRMAAAGGEHVGEVSTTVRVDDLFEEVRSRLDERQAARWKTSSDVESVEGPREALIQLVENIARNGFDACAEGNVELRVKGHAETVELSFEDAGTGMDAETIKRATDPFFTTKDAANRMGLGLFLARTLVDSLGGRLDVDSVKGRGTTVRVFLPRNA